jgi:hypothetical protein
MSIQSSFFSSPAMDNVREIIRTAHARMDALKAQKLEGSKPQPTSFDSTPAGIGNEDARNFFARFC